MSSRIDEFVNDVCSYIKCKDVHSDVKEELSLHIDELKDNYVYGGLSDFEAEQKAICDMGSAAEFGEKLNKQHKPPIEWNLIILTAIISVFGVLVMFVSSKFDNQPISFSKYVLYVVFGVAVLVGLYFVDYVKLKKHPVVLYFVALLIIILCEFFGTDYAGVNRFFVVGGFTVSVNSVAAILFVISFVFCLYASVESLNAVLCLSRAVFASFTESLYVLVLAVTLLNAFCDVSLSLLAPATALFIPRSSASVF